MSKLLDLKQQHKAALDKADHIVKAAENATRAMTAEETKDFDAAMVEVDALAASIQRIEKMNTLRAQASINQLVPASEAAKSTGRNARKVFTADYEAAFWDNFMASGGRDVNAALYEGSNTAGGYAVPITVDGQIVPLAPQEMAIRQLARVIPTTNDIKFPIKNAHGTAAAKSEGDGTGTNTFGGTSPAIGQVTLSAFMAGDVVPASWELLQDVAAAQPFLTDDITLAVQQYEEPLFITGTGSGQPQGVATGATVNSNVTLAGTTGVVGKVTLDSMDDLEGNLNAVYLANASWLMNRTTLTFLRKLQRQANLFDPVLVFQNGTWYYNGKPIFISSSVQDQSTNNNKPVLFGDFKRGFVIGDRGGSGINVKVLDQTRAKEGMVEFLAYRRTDSRVIRSEAIQAIKVVTG